MSDKDIGTSQICRWISRSCLVPCKHFNSLGSLGLFICLLSSPWCSSRHKTLVILFLHTGPSGFNLPLFNLVTIYLSFITQQEVNMYKFCIWTVWNLFSVSVLSSGVKLHLSVSPSSELMSPHLLFFFPDMRTPWCRLTASPVSLTCAVRGGTCLSLLTHTLTWTWMSTNTQMILNDSYLQGYKHQNYPQTHSTQQSTAKQATSN